MYLLLAVLGLGCCAGFSPVAVSGGCFPGAVCGLLPGMASLVAERGLQGVWASVVGAHWLSCSGACGILPDQG